MLYLLSAYPVREGDEPGTVGLDRIGALVAGDWGWWRTLTMNVERIAELAETTAAGLIPAGARYDPVAQLRRIGEHAHAVPKTLRWRLRARVGERARWYQLPDEEAHD